MAYLHNFTVTVLLVAFLCFFCESLTCTGPLAKYTSLVTGLVISLAVVCAFLQIRDVDFAEFSFDEMVYAGPQLADAAVTAQFAQNLETEIERRLQSDLGMTVHVTAEVSNNEGVLTIDQVEIEGASLERAGVVRYVETQFGIKPEVK